MRCDNCGKTKRIGGAYPANEERWLRVEKVPDFGTGGEPVDLCGYDCASRFYADKASVHGYSEVHTAPSVEIPPVAFRASQG